MLSGLLAVILLVQSDAPSSQPEAAPRAAQTRPAPSPARTIYRDPGRYDSFPDVQRLSDGRILCVFRDASLNQRIRHIEPDARIMGALSADNGVRWSDPFVIYDDPACQNDPSLGVLRDGRLLLTFFTWAPLGTGVPDARRHPFARKVDRGAWGEYAEVAGVYLLAGKTEPLEWEKQARHLVGDSENLAATSSSILQTRSGTLLLPIYGRSTRFKSDVAYVLRSTDGGHSWSPPVQIARDPEERISMQEPAIGQAGDGAIVALMRTTNAEDHLYLARSTDDGLTWTPPERTDLIGHPADVDLLPHGGLLAVYGYRHAPFGVRACVSRDHGKTWDRAREVVITAEGEHVDLGYPSACLTSDGHVLIAYYMNTKGTKARWIECRRLSISALP